MRERPSWRTQSCSSDDDQNILKLEQAILSKQGYDVTLARGGKECLALLAERDFDLVLLDVMMPDVDGYTVCRKIPGESRFDDMPVIFLTAKGGSDALGEGFDAGAAMYIRKPFTASKLLEIVRTALDGRGAKT